MLLPDRRVPAGDERSLLPAIASLAALFVLAGAGYLMLPVRPPAPSPIPAPTPFPAPVEMTRDRLVGTWVGALDGEALVLRISAASGSKDRVECALNAGTREVIAFQAVVERDRGLESRTLPGYEVHFAAGYQDDDGRLKIPLVDEGGRSRGFLSKTESSDRR